MLGQRGKTWLVAIFWLLCLALAGLIGIVLRLRSGSHCCGKE